MWRRAGAPVEVVTAALVFVVEAVVGAVVVADVALLVLEQAVSATAVAIDAIKATRVEDMTRS